MRTSRLRNAIALLLAAAAAPALPTGAVAQEGCTVTIDPCCALRPGYSDPNYSFTADVLVGTRETEFSTSTQACVTIFDITPPYPGDGTNFAAVQRYHGPGDTWNVTNLGSVFGLTIDKFGNIFVCHTTCYGSDFVGPGGLGAVYRIAAGTGAINTFVTLPNTFNVGLGNISYDCDNDQFFVTNHEDGRIYRVKRATSNAPTAAVLESFDPLGADDGTVGFAPLGERLWGVQWHAGRVYYSVWSQNCNETTGGPNSIRSIALDNTGAFVPASDQLEFTVPAHVNGYSHPVSDISFSNKGHMLLAERSMSGPSFPAAHESRLLEYACGASGLPTWAPSGNTYALGIPATCCCSGIAGNGTNSAGGVDADYSTYVPGTPYGRVWGTSDAMNFSLTVYGIQGLPPGGGTPSNSAWVDMDGSTSSSEKTSLGDVEVPCPDLATATTLALFTASPVAGGLELRWAFGESDPLTGIRLERSRFATGPWTGVGAAARVEGGQSVVLDREVEAGHSYFYRLVVSTAAGETHTFGPVSGTAEAAIAQFALVQKTPTPSDGRVELEFAVPRAAHVRVSVIDVQGRELAVLAEGRHEPGRYTVTWSADGAAGGGVYFVRYRTPAGNFQQRVVITP